jgi:hypothetical protein
MSSVQHLRKIWDRTRSNQKHIPSVSEENSVQNLPLTVRRKECQVLGYCGSQYTEST